MQMQWASCLARNSTRASPNASTRSVLRTHFETTNSSRLSRCLKTSSECQTTSLLNNHDDKNLPPGANHLIQSTRHFVTPFCQTKHKVAILGGGSWGSAISKVIGSNVVKYPHVFDEEVFLYLRDTNLRLIIEKTRENIRYLTGFKLPKNVTPISDLNHAVSRSNILIFVIPHEYIRDLCYSISGSSVAKSKPIGISLIKGLHVDYQGNLELTTEIINRMLGIQMGVLSGANVAMDVAREEFSGATLSAPKILFDNSVSQSQQMQLQSQQTDMIKALFQTEYFRIHLNDDIRTIEMCGALKNVVACGAGIIDGLDFGPNTKAAAIRTGLMEAIRFVEYFHPEYKLSTFFENCGIADMISSSFAGRNRLVIEALIKTTKSLDVLERELLGGQKLQGPHTAEVVYDVLLKKGLMEQFPFFSTVHKICVREAEPMSLINALCRSN